MATWVKYVRLESWHIVDGDKTKCGIEFDAEINPVSITLPMHEKSCENCLRLVAHDKDQATE